jgi:hypothetical protein
MTIIRILLILGLVYIALQQKKGSTRNVILVVTGLLAFCMMSQEGMVEASAATCTGTPTATVADCTETASTSVSADKTACDTVTGVSLNDHTLCSGVTTTADGSVGACTYSPSAVPATTCEVDLSTTECPHGCTGSEAVVSTYNQVDCSTNSWYNKYDASAKECVGSLDDEDEDE